MEIKKIANDALGLLKEMISIPSISTKENDVSGFLYKYIEGCGLKPYRKGNNVWVKNSSFSLSRPTILLDSHLDTVKPCDGWLTNPFEPFIQDGKLFGLGSNDAGVSLVALFEVFRYFNECRKLDFNLIFSASAEEEISGANGIQLILPELGKIDLGIIGEPTNMNMAIAEKGLMVLDCISEGTVKHAAHINHNNAILNCMEDLEWFRNYSFKKKSNLLGSTTVSVTQINGGQQHNVTPAHCHFVVDVRVNEKYSNEEVLNIISKSIFSEISARSTNLKASSISIEHPIVQKGIEMGMAIYGSNTLSNQALLDFPTVKIGPGDSSRSHTANEFIYIDEILQGIKIYTELLNNFKLN